jgi:hypothetical protein
MNKVIFHFICISREEQYVYLKETIVKNLLGNVNDGRDAVEDIHTLKKVTSAKRSAVELFPYCNYHVAVQHDVV